MSSHTASRKSTARKALYFARRRTDRSLTTLKRSVTANIRKALNSHRSSLHASSTDGAVVTQLQFYADIVDLVTSSSRSSSSPDLDQAPRSAVQQFIDVYRSLVDCVGSLGAERAACTAFLPARQLPQAGCDHVDNREVFLYAQAAFASEICFRSLGRQATAATKSKVLAAVRLYRDDGEGLAICRRRLLPDFDGATAKRAQTPSAADSWKCGRARRLRQLRRLQTSLNESISDEADSMLGEMERDTVETWTDERYAACWRLAVTVASLSTSVVYLVIGYSCQCRAVLHRCRCNATMMPAPRDNAADHSELDADDNYLNDLERHSLRVANLLTKSTSV